MREYCRSPFKTAPINIFILTIEQMTTCDVKTVIHSDKPTENYHLTRHSALVYFYCAYQHCAFIFSEKA